MRETENLIHNNCLCAVVLIVLTLFASQALAQDVNRIGLRADTSRDTMLGNRKPGSHIKVFLPYLPYLAISHSVNAAWLGIRPGSLTYQNK